MATVKKEVKDIPMPKNYKTKDGRVLPATATLHKNRVKLGLTPADVVFDEVTTLTPAQKGALKKAENKAKAEAEAAAELAKA